MNTFGRQFRIHIYGESHGSSVGVIIDGCPAGILINREEFIQDLERRKGGSTGTTHRVEADIPIFQNGVFENHTTGAPLHIYFENSSHDPNDYKDIRNLPRPGHADFAAFKKYGGYNDWRGGGHFSGRLTAGLVAAGVVAKKLIHPVSVQSEIIEVGGSRDIEKAVEDAAGENDSIGGLIECRINNVPVGLGEPWFDSVESMISHMAFSIPAVKGIEFGAGFNSARMRGSEMNDEIQDSSGKTRTNNSGGINGGITNGNPVIFRIAVKPASSIGKQQSTINLATGAREDLLIRGRHDICLALRMPVIIEAATACVMADLMMTGGLITRSTERTDEYGC